MTIHLPKVNQFGGGNGGGGGSSSFPTIVTDSGSSLPVTTGYQLNDTFLNTSDKKIYKTIVDSYEWNTDVTHGEVTIDFITGVVTNVSTIGSKRLYKTFSENLWTGNKSYQIKFKINSFPTYTNWQIPLMSFEYGSSPSKHVCFGIDENKKIIYSEATISSGSATINKYVSCLNTVLQLDKEYTLVINKTGESCATSLLESGIEIENNSFDGVTNFTSSSNNKINIGFGYFSAGSGAYRNLGTNGDIYLLETSGEFLKPSSTLSWDNGTSLTDKTEYADKTNGALYLYENSELVKIGGSLTKKVYTISADNTSTLDVSSDFTKVVDVLKNGVELALTDDYTISSGVITFVTALSTTDKITVKGE